MKCVASVGSNASDVIVCSDTERNGGCKKKDCYHVEFLRELHEAQVARGRYFVHELTSQANSRMKCVMMIMAMPGASTAAGCKYKCTGAEWTCEKTEARKWNREDLGFWASCPSNGRATEGG